MAVMPEPEAVIVIGEEPIAVKPVQERPEPQDTDVVATLWYAEEPP
jgi:hypothetical protein